MPVSLTAPVILPYSLNAVTPNIGTGFDLGVEIHGLVADKFGYEIGLFNGTGAAVNTATKTFSDDRHIPSLLYAGRFTYMPKGVMPATQGNPNRLNEDKIMFGISTSINVESENESTNDYRAGLEFAMLITWAAMYKVVTSLPPVCKQLHAMISSTVTEWTPMVF